MISTHTATTASLQTSNSENKGMWGWFGIGTGVGVCVGIVIGMFFMFAWQRKLGFLRYCSDDQVDGPCNELSSSKGACGSDKKSTVNVEKGIPNSDSFLSPAKAKNEQPLNSLANGKCDSIQCSAKEKNNYNTNVDPLRYPPKYIQSNMSCGTNCDPLVPLHQRRTSQPAKILKMQESPQHRMRSTSLVHTTNVVPVQFTSEAVSNKDMARYGSNYSLDPDTAKPTLTPTANKVYFDSKRDSIDLDQTLYKSTDC